MTYNVNVSRGFHTSQDRLQCERSLTLISLLVSCKESEDNGEMHMILIYLRYNGASSYGLKEDLKMLGKFCWRKIIFKT